MVRCVYEQELTNPRAYHVGRMGARISRHLALDDPVHFPVTAVLCGRRNNVAEPQSETPLPIHSITIFPVKVSHACLPHFSFFIFHFDRGTTNH